MPQYRKIPFLLYVLVGTMLMIASTVSAQQQLEQTNLLERDGTVYYVNMQNSELNVDDKSFTITPDTVVKNADGSEGSLLSLTRGTPVHLQYERRVISNGNVDFPVHSISILR